MLAPKRQNESTGWLETNFFDYYAAYSHAFVERALSSLALDSQAIVLDPWNGRGTTTTVAAEKGLAALGIDLNPAMVAIAEARLAAPQLVKRAIARLKKRGTPTKRSVPTNGLLELWLTPSSARAVAAISQVLDDATLSVSEGSQLTARSYVANARRLRSYLLLSLSRALREVLKPVQSSNPTWLRRSLKLTERLRPTLSDIWANTLDSASATLASLSETAWTNAERVIITNGDSRSLPLPSNSIDAVVTSPPYCTRIDYAVATCPELAVFCDLTPRSFRLLREQLMGTTAITLNTAFRPPIIWGPTCVETLDLIRKHHSKASSTYYLKNFLQYFSSLNVSLGELNRVTRAGALLTFVVQDSYYKDVHIDLARILLDMGSALGWKLRDKEDHELSTTLAASNPKARVYRTNFSAVESVLYMERGGKR